jgi:hypothetical protein
MRGCAGTAQTGLEIMVSLKNKLKAVARITVLNRAPSPSPGTPGPRSTGGGKETTITTIIHVPTPKKQGRGILPAVLGGVLTLLAGCDGGNDSAPTVSSFEASVPGNFTRHSARDGKIAVRTPPNWVETSTSGTVVLNFRTGEHGSSLNVQVLPAMSGETLGKTMSSVPDELRHEFADFKEIRNDLIFLNDLPAGRLVYEASRGGFHGKLMQIFITKNKTHYILTYTATPKRFEIEEPTVEEVVASIEIEK